jgi:NADPH2:quinone reductase
MKAAYIEETGPPEMIRYGELPEPEVGPHQALVRVKAVSVNPIDTYLRAGADFWELPRPFIIGCDLAGVVEQVGEEVDALKPGDRVWGSNQGLLGRQGTFAELCAVDQDWLYRTPDGVGDEAAAACALVGITAHLGLFRDAQLQPGETILVQGGSGGVGSMVVQLAKAAGAHVIATGGSDQKVERCRELGADIAVNYRTGNVAEVVQQHRPEGVDVFWETSREPDFEAIVPLLAERGRIVLMAGRDARPQLPVGPFYVKQCRLYGFVMFKATPDEQRQCAVAINKHLSAGQLRPQIDRVLPLPQAAEAHRLQEENTVQGSGTLAGKIVLTTGEN